MIPCPGRLSPTWRQLSWAQLLHSPRGLVAAAQGKQPAPVGQHEKCCTVPSVLALPAQIQGQMTLLLDRPLPTTAGPSGALQGTHSLPLPENSCPMSAGRYEPCHCKIHHLHQNYVHNLGFHHSHWGLQKEPWKCDLNVRHSLSPLLCKGGGAALSMTDTAMLLECAESLSASL